MIFSVKGFQKKSDDRLRVSVAQTVDTPGICSCGAAYLLENICNK